LSPPDTVPTMLVAFISLAALGAVCAALGISEILGVIFDSSSEDEIEADDAEPCGDEDFAADGHRRWD
jgi:hypothetical protein